MEVKRNGRDIQNGRIGDDLGGEILEEDDEEGFMHYYFFRAVMSTKKFARFY